MICRAILPSETYAMKAQRILASNGYPCEMVRSTSKKEGCGFGLKVVGDCEQIHRLFDSGGNPCADSQN